MTLTRTLLFVSILALRSFLPCNCHATYNFCLPRPYTLEILLWRRRCAQSARPDLEPNISLSGPSTPSISILSYDHFVASSIVRCFDFLSALEVTWQLKTSVALLRTVLQDSIDFAGRTCSNRACAFFRPSYFDEYGPDKGPFVMVFQRNSARGCTGHMIKPYYLTYTRTSRKRPPKMSSLGGRLLEGVPRPYEGQSLFWAKIFPH